MSNIQKYSRSSHSTAMVPRSYRRIYVVLLVVMAIALVVVSIGFAQAASYRNNTKQQLSRRLHSAVIDAIDQVNRMTGGVQANSTQRLAMVRQYVYSIDQLNEISISISGEEGRMVPQEAISALYDDLDTYERVVQTATSSTLEVRTNLLTHLTALQSLL